MRRLRALWKARAMTPERLAEMEQHLAKGCLLPVWVQRELVAEVKRLQVDTEWIRAEHETWRACAHRLENERDEARAAIATCPVCGESWSAGEWDERVGNLREELNEARAEVDHLRQLIHGTPVVDPKRGARFMTLTRPAEPDGPGIDPDNMEEP